MKITRVLPPMLCLSVLLATPVLADAPGVAREWRVRNEQAIVDGFVALLSIPNKVAKS